MPVLFCKRAAVDELVKQSLGKDLATIEQEIDKDLKPQSGLLEGWSAACQANIVRKKTTVKNVLGVLEGEGPLAEETVIIGAHYDHIGVPGEGVFCQQEGDDTICNGADDNASGTAMVLEVARAYADAGYQPKRTVVFAHFAGEELGLFGSKALAEDPPDVAPFAGGTVVAMVNVDMVGRYADKGLAIGATSSSDHWLPLLQHV